MTLREYVLRWQEAYDKPQSRPTTYAAHGYIFKNHILPRLGEIQLSELTVEQVGDFLDCQQKLRYATGLYRHTGSLGKCMVHVSGVGASGSYGRSGLYDSAGPFPCQT